MPLKLPCAYSTIFETRDYELDAEGIVNNAVYLHYLEYVRHQFCRDAGLSFGQMREKGITPVLHSVNIRYLQSLGGGEKVVGRLNLRRKGAAFVFHQDITREDGTVAAEAEVTVVCLENGKISRGQLLQEAFKVYMTEF